MGSDCPRHPKGYRAARGYRFGLLGEFGPFRTGTIATTLVPPAEGEKTTNCPPLSASRSCMLMMPPLRIGRPSPWDEFRPTPSSSMDSSIRSEVNSKRTLT